MTQQFVRKTVSQALQNRNLVARLSPEARKLFDTIAPTYDQYVANKNNDDIFKPLTFRADTEYEAIRKAFNTWSKRNEN
jgi:hypothetical protein